MDDATNSAVWQRRKLHTLKLKSVYYCPNTGRAVCLERLADILPVEGGSAYHTLSLTKKAFHSLGAPFVDDAFRLPRSSVSSGGWFCQELGPESGGRVGGTGIRCYQELGPDIGGGGS